MLMEEMHLHNSLFSWRDASLDLVSRSNDLLHITLGHPVGVVCMPSCEGLSRPVAGIVYYGQRRDLALGARMSASASC